MSAPENVPALGEEPVVGTPEPDYSGYGTRQEMRKEILRLVEMLREAQRERDDYRFWNERVRTCEHHTQAVAAPVGDCLICNVDAAEQALQDSRREVERIRELAKTARSQAAAPDYDEEAIRDALWAVVDAALAPEPEGER